MNGLSSSEFGRLFLQYRDRFVALADSYVHERAVAEDIVADAFTKFWDSRGSVELSTASPQSYILSMVRNRCLNYLRDTASHSRILDATVREDLASMEGLDPQFMISDELEQILSRFIATLPDDRREIFLASRFEGLSHTEIALKYGYTPRKVRREIGKALASLRDVLKSYL